MNTLAALNILLVGLWMGMYLFTTFVVSPAFVALFPIEAERHAHRRTLGRYYARVNGPLSAALLLVALWQLLHGFNLWLALEIACLLLVGVMVASHVRRAEGSEQAPPRLLTNLTLLLSVLLCGFSLGGAL